MPRYDYRCTSCADVFEIEHGMREHPAISCPVCGSPAERLFNASGIVLKGSGFYNTDQRGKKGGTKATSGTVGDTADSPAADKATSGASEAAAPAACPSSTSCDCACPAKSEPAAAKA